jgi:hypothetical protein
VCSSDLDEFLACSTSFHLTKMRLLGIESVAFRPHPFTGGVIRVATSRQAIVIPLTLRHCGDLAARLQEACSDTAISCTVAAGTWHEIRRRCARADAAIRRASRLYPPLLRMSIGLIPAILFVGGFFWDLPLVPLMLWTIAAPLAPYAACIAAEGIIRVRERRDVSRGGREGEAATVDEVKYFVRCGLAALLLLLAAGVIGKAFIP